ncbi:MAG: hypothetical protein ACFB10_19725 [Salibacteraceae bacterium]
MFSIQFLAFMLVAGGLLFRIMHWPGGDLLLIGGLAVAVIWFILAFFYSKAKKDLSDPDILDSDLDL